MVALSFSRKALGPVLGGLESKSGSEIRLNPLPTQVPAKSARGPKTSGSERLAVDSPRRVWRWAVSAMACSFQVATGGGRKNASYFRHATRGRCDVNLITRRFQPGRISPEAIAGCEVAHT